MVVNNVNRDSYWDIGWDVYLLLSGERVLALLPAEAGQEGFSNAY